MTIYDKYTEHHSYQIQKITNKEKKDLLFLRSGVNQLKYVGDMYKTLPMDHPPPLHYLPL